MEKEFDFEEVEEGNEPIDQDEEEVDWSEFAAAMNQPDDEIAVSFIHRRLTGRSSNYMHYIPYTLRLKAGAIG
jgi:hypothetical protein